MQLYDQDDQAYSVSYTVDASHDKSISIEGVSLFTTLRKIINDFIIKFKPNILTFLPSDKDEEARNKKERINSLLTIPGFEKRKVGISTVFSRILKENFNINGFITNIKYKLHNPSLVKNFIDSDGNMIYIDIPITQLISMDAGENLINTANQYKQVKNAYIDGDNKTIKIQIETDEPIS
jgi:hypothetical protein